jgi:formylglycine-generating enzyme required for sulfatase activity
MFKMTAYCRDMPCIQESAKRIMNVKTDDDKLVAEGYRDIGSAIIRRIDLIKVALFKATSKPAMTPELVDIPGGRFVMGDDDTEPMKPRPAKFACSPSPSANIR